MKTYLDQYQEYIEPHLHNIDVFIKTELPPYSLEKVASVLHITPQEVSTILEKEKINTVDSCNFFQIMKNGSSDICKLFARELNCGTPVFYSVENISYIYDLDIFRVMDAAKEMGIHYFTTPLMKYLFQRIPQPQD